MNDGHFKSLYVEISFLYTLFENARDKIILQQQGVPFSPLSWSKQANEKFYRLGVKNLFLKTYIIWYDIN